MTEITDTKLPIQMVDVNLIISEHLNSPQIEIRKRTTKPDLIKALIEAAWNGKALTILPKFNNKVQAINSLQEKGIINPVKNETTGEINYEFLI